MSLRSELVVGGCRLDTVIGRGGMGTVYRATQLALGREVAVKVVPAQGVEAALVERFKREARIAAAVEHPHLVPIHAAGEQDGLLYLVMRLVAGIDLGALLTRDGPLAARAAVSIIEQVASALDAIHAAGELAVAARVAVESPHRSRGLRVAVALTTVAVAVMVALVALFAGGSGTKSADRRPVRSHSRAETTLALATGTTSAFTFSYPSGWHVVDAELPMGSFMRTRVVSATGAEAVIIDRSPSETLGLQPWATGVQNATSQTTGYQLISLGPETFGSRAAVIWRFAIRSSPYPHRVDIFQQVGAGGYAVLSEGRTFTQVARTAVAVATSLHSR